MSIVRTLKADPSWAVELRQRKAILWIGSSAFSGKQLPTEVRKLFRKTWQAILVDAPCKVEDKLLATFAVDDGYTLRHYTDTAGPELVPANRIPVYWLRGEKGETEAGNLSNPLGLMARFEKLKKTPSGLTVFVVGEVDTKSIREALSLAPDAFASIVFVIPDERPLSDSEEFGRFFAWESTLTSFSDYVSEIADQTGDDKRLSILVRAPGSKGKIELDISNCVDDGHPITQAFDFVSAEAILGDVSLTEEEVRDFFADPTASWKPYNARIPWPRHCVAEYARELKRRLKRFDSEGPSMTCTCWVPSEVGAGTTTALRQLAYEIALDGYPVMLAKANMDRLDFKQLAAFLSSTADIATNDERIASPFPWIVMFDAEQSSLLWDAMKGLANGLKNLKRSAIVVLVRQQIELDCLEKALGTNRNLGGELQNKISLEEGVELGKHVQKFLPSVINRTDQDWRSFINESGRNYDGNNQSLFWVALRFWLFSVKEAEGTFRKFVSDKLRRLAASNISGATAVLEIAALAKHRIPMPIKLLPEMGQSALREVNTEQLDVLGVRKLEKQNRITIVHPFIAEEILRVSLGINEFFESFGKTAFISPLELELFLIGEILKRSNAGHEECLLVVEELVTSALRVDPRQNPRTYPIRDRIVSILENANGSIWDSSQVFNHHVAKARRHLALDPPSGEWTLAARREQLDLAVKHILDAMNNVQPVVEEHEESELNLLVSLALTYSAKSRLERFDDAGDKILGDEYDQLAAKHYGQAQLIDADNSYLLENFARHKINAAALATPGQARTKSLVEAIHLLELEQFLDDHGFRIYQTTEELAKAYSMLQEGDGIQTLESLAQSGNEPAIVAIAKIRLQEVCIDREQRVGSLKDAEKILQSVKEENKTWRSQLALYRVVSELRPHDFVVRLEILENIERLGDDFGWPQQLRLEHAILLLQAGDETSRQRGKDKFKAIRDQLVSKSSWIEVPEDLKFLRDPKTGFTEPLKTHIVVSDVSSVGKSSFGIPDGWRNVDVVFRAHRFPKDRIRKTDELDCVIQFTTFGPQAIPLTSWEASKGE
jgi:hypothetical protein